MPVYLDDLKKDVVIMNMGSIKDDDNNLRMLNMGTGAGFKGRKVTKYYGAGKSSEFTNRLSLTVDQSGMEYILAYDPKLKNINPSDLNLKKVIEVISNSEIVFTGRYHGMVFARTLGVKYDTLGMDTDKIIWEEPVSDIRECVLDSYENIRLLRQIMGLFEHNILM